jgi:hypothetical protein
VGGFLAAASRTAAALDKQAVAAAAVPQEDGSIPATISARPARHLLRLTQYLGPKEMVAAQLPHLKWTPECPPIASFYSYATAEKVVVP